MIRVSGKSGDPDCLIFFVHYTHVFHLNKLAYDGDDDDDYYFFFINLVRMFDWVT